MIWKNVELFNVSEVEKREDGAIMMRRFPRAVLDSFICAKPSWPMTVGRLTTGCEIRFVGESADVVVSSSDIDGTVEIWRGDFLCGTRALPAGVPQMLHLRPDYGVDSHDISAYHGSFDTAVWRVVFDHDFCAVIHDIEAITPIRPPLPEEVPEKRILCYGSSITNSAGSGYYTNSYISTMGRVLGADVLCKGMGGSCFVQNEVADYIAGEDWDVLTLELGINMVDRFPVSVFEERATYMVERVLEVGKPVVLISNFYSHHNIEGSRFEKENRDYVETLERIYEKHKCDRLYYIKGTEIATDPSYLLADVLHPSPYGHAEMGRKIAKILREDFKII